MRKPIRTVVNKALRTTGYQINKSRSPFADTQSVPAPEPIEISEPEEVEKPHPDDYSTTDNPIEVPMQKQSYFTALNEYIREGDKVLDVGCGVGYGMTILSIKAAEVYGVDVDEKAIEYIRSYLVGQNPRLKGVKVYNGKRLPFADKSFDVITTIEVIEHVLDYDSYIDELMRVAKRVVFIATPNRRPEFTNPDGTPLNYWHYREWNRKELNTILRKHHDKVDWHLINGPWDGPFTVSKEVKVDTITLAPALLLSKA